MSDKFLAIGLSLLILIQAGLVRQMVGTWIFPSAMFGLFWFLLTFIPLIAMFSAPVSLLAVSYILVSCAVFSATSALFNWKNAFLINRNYSNNFYYGSRLIRTIFYSLSFLSLILLLLDVRSQGFSLFDVFDDVIGVATRYIILRYEQEVVVTIFGRVGVVLTYVSAILGGCYFSSSTNIRVRIQVVILFLLPSMLAVVLQGNRGTLFLALSYFLAGILLVKLSRNDLKLVRKNDVYILFVLAVLILATVVFSFFARGMSELTDYSEIETALTNKFLSYTSAHIYAFSDWFQNVVVNEGSNLYVDQNIGIGFNTFMSIHKIFGYDGYTPIGFNAEEYSYSGVITNIYTIFRGLIVDFGVLGSLFFVFILGLFLHLSFYVLLISKSKALPASIFVHSIGYIYTSFMISQLVWNSIYGSFVILILIFYCNNRYCKS